MAVGTIERLYKVTVDGTEAVRQLQKIADSTGAVDSKLDAFGASLKKAGAALGGAFAVREVIGQFRSLVDAMDELGDAAQRVGVSAGNLQALRHAAAMSGGSAELLDRGLERLSANLQGVDDATTDAAKALRAFGVTGADSAEQALAKMAEAFARMPDGAQKTAMALDVLGKSGAQLIPTLNNGSAGLQDLADEAQRLGIVLSDETIAAAQRFNDQMDLLGQTTAAAAQQGIAPLLPALTAIASVLTDVAARGTGASSWAKAFGDVLLTVAQSATIVSGGFDKVLVTVGAFADLMTTPWEKGGSIIDAWRQSMEDLDDQTSDTMLKLEEARRAAAAPLPTPKATGPVGPNIPAVTLAERQRDAEKAAAEARRAATQAAADAAKLQQTYATILRETTVELEDQKQAEVGLAAARAAAANTDQQAAAAQQQLRDSQRELADARDKATASIDAQIQAQRDADLEMQAMIELAANGTEEQKKLAGAWLEHALAIKQAAPVFDAAQEVFQTLEGGFDRFVDALSSGSVTAAEAFRGMVQSIIADLLKLWAKKFIIDKLVGLFGGGGSNADSLGAADAFARGGVFAQGKVSAFATGGIITSPVRLPMALMGEAGPEAVMPLRRGADGRLGVEAGGGAVTALNVAIHNHTDASISARRDSRGDLQILVEATKKSLAADVRRGGNDFSRAAEAAWRLSRGAAAPF